MAAFPYTVELADGRKLQVLEAEEGAAYSLQVEGEAPAPLDDPNDLLALSLLLEYAASKRRNHRDGISIEQEHRVRAREEGPAASD